MGGSGDAEYYKTCCMILMVLGLTLLCLYLLVLGLTGEGSVAGSAALLISVEALFGVASYVLNATLYARGKILMPFVPVVHLCIVCRCFRKSGSGETQLAICGRFLIFAVSQC